MRVVSLFAVLSPFSVEGAGLSGHVSVDEGSMEGVLVSAKLEGSTIRLTVITDAQGRYEFPPTKLVPGHYKLSIRAAGFDLAGPPEADLSDEPATIDLKLKKTEDLAAQLSNLEWATSAPESPRRKQLINCTGCHTLERVFRSKYTSDDFVQLIPRMNGYAPMSTPKHPQLPVGERIRTGGARGEEAVRKLADYLASINLGQGPTWNYPLKAFPRVKGKATRVVITEYELPRPDMSEPHDVVLDENGTVWYSDFGEQILGKLDPKTGKVTEYPTPVLKPQAPTGALDLELDRDGNPWIALMYQGAIAKFDKKAEQFRLFPIPPSFNDDRTQQTMLVPNQAHIDGKVWMGDVGSRKIFRLDLDSGKIEQIDPFKNDKGRPHSTYGLAADAQNNLWFLDYADQHIGKIDARSGQATLYPTPTPASRPRRGHMHPDGRLAFGEFGGDKVAVFDTRSEQFQEWPAQQNSAPYDAVLDKNGEIWSADMMSDSVHRLDPRSGESVSYPLPRETNVRRVFVDNSSSPVTFWAGNNHAGSIVKLEPLD